MQRTGMAAMNSTPYTISERSSVVSLDLKPLINTSSLIERFNIIFIPQNALNVKRKDVNR
jgi:hypothetical protein